jgi:hypothetical protein
MKKFIFLIAFVFLTTTTIQLNAQSLHNTDWKTLLGDPINDTITLHIRMDSSFVTTGAGDTVVRSLCIISGDTVTLKDYEGKYACPNTDGKYKFSLSGTMLIFTLINDPCDGRVQSINGAKWTKAWK